MKRLFFLSTLLLCAIASACPGAHAQSAVDLVIPNFDTNGPACRVRINVKAETCASTSCLLPAPKGAASEPTELRFSCIPTSAQTGFENPPSDVKIQSIKTKTSKGHLSLIDDITTPAAERAQELNFCLWGKKNVFCGNANTNKVRGKQAPVVKELIDLIKRIELVETPDK